MSNTDQNIATTPEAQSDVLSPITPTKVDDSAVEFEALSAWSTSLPKEETPIEDYPWMEEGHE